MNLQMFGSKGMKSKSELKKVNIPTDTPTKTDEAWQTDELDALHVPILCSESAPETESGHYSPDLLNPFGVYTNDENSGTTEKKHVQPSANNSEALDAPLFDEQCDDILEDAHLELDESLSATPTSPEASSDEPELPILEAALELDEALVEESSAQIEEPSAQIEEPLAAIEEPSATIEKPSATIEKPSASIEKPSATLDMTSVTAEVLEAEPASGPTLKDLPELIILDDEPAHGEIRTAEDSAHITNIGVYANTEFYVKSICKELSKTTDIDLHCFDPSMSVEQLKDAQDAQLWIVNLADEDESDLLDTILDLSAETPTLYLSGGLSKLCKDKIWAFLHENHACASEG